MNFKSQHWWKKWLAPLFLALIVPALSSCKAQSNDEQAPPSKPPMGTKVALTLTGYNYTNRYIDTFSVDGAGGGNLFVSHGASGGGGSVCCVSYVTGARARKVSVRWQTGACTFGEYTNSSGVKYHEIHSFFKEVEVQIDPRIPDQPAYFEVHFYPDGHVEAAITEHASPPRLLLSKDREDRSHYPQCPNDKEPEK
ncbi:MAG: DUF3304 domain-containing protein [Pseudomonadota bacterium]